MENIIWQTEAKLRNEYDIIENVELTLDEVGDVTIRVIRSTEQEDDISIPRTLSVKEAIVNEHDTHKHGLRKGNKYPCQTQQGDTDD